MTTATTQDSIAYGNTVLPRLTLAGTGIAPLRLVAQDQPRYREVARLGAGGVGAVMLAEDADIGRPVAIKRLHDNGDPGLTMRFVDEIRVLGQLDHPNIVPIHDVGRDADGGYYLVMKRLEGDTLETVIGKLRVGDPAMTARFPLEVRIEVFAQVLRALQLAHARRIVHRDLKPSNIMVGRYGEVAVLDWGIAKRLDDPTSDALDRHLPAPEARAFHTRVGTLLGTPAYMSPEQASGAALDERSDIYSLGALLYELVTLRHYLPDISDLDAVLAGVRDHVPPPAAFVAAVPMELSFYIARALDKDPGERFASIEEMIEALHRIHDGRFPVTCPVTLAKRILAGAGHVVDANPKKTATAMALLALAAVASVVAGIVAVLP
jgi:serine/threonine-protein kinase